MNSIYLLESLNFLPYLFNCHQIIFQLVLFYLIVSFLSGSGSSRIEILLQYSALVFIFILLNTATAQQQGTTIIFFRPQKQHQNQNNQVSAGTIIIAIVFIIILIAIIVYSIYTCKNKSNKREQGGYSAGYYAQPGQPRDCYDPSYDMRYWHNPGP